MNSLKNILAARYSESVVYALRKLRAEVRAALATRRSAQKFQELRGSAGLKVHLGCGPHLKSGWINIDLTDSPPHTNGATFINYDLRRGLPLEEGSAALIYSSHFFEHLEYSQGVRLMRDCYRALCPGGTFRISLPDFKTSFAAYLRGDATHFDLYDIHAVMPDLEPGTESIVDHINYAVYQYGEHKCIYDEEKMIALLRKVGFQLVAESSFQPEIDPDEPLRQRHSFYVEAVK